MSSIPRIPCPRLCLLALSVALVSVAGCQKSDSEAKPSGERTQDPVPETPKDAPTGPFASFDFEATAKRWQGAWLLNANSRFGKAAVWSIEGKTLTIIDSKGESSYDFAVYSPCQVARTDADAGVTTYTVFTFAGDQLYAGLGSAGLRVGESTIVCASGNVYVLEGETCSEWSEVFDDWKREDSECAIEGEGEARRFKVEGRELEFVADDALVNSQMKGNAARRYPDLAAARAALAEALAPADKPPAAGEPGADGGK